VGIPGVTQDHASGTQSQVIQGPITCNPNMKLQHKVHAFLDKINLKTYENVIVTTRPGKYRTIA
jgi:hypothetical protein